MSTRDGKIWEAFMNSDFVRDQLSKQAQAADDRGKSYDVDPQNKTKLSESAKTKGVASGGGSLVGSGDSSKLYHMSEASVPAAQDGDVVEGLEDRHSKMLEVALKNPSGEPKGTQDLQAEKWANLKSFTKKAELEDEEDYYPEEKEEEDVEELDFSNESLYKMLDKLEEDEEGDVDLDELLEDLEEEEHTSKEATISLLKELVKIANELDEEGSHQDADEIDQVLKEEIRSFASAQKKKLASFQKKKSTN